MTIRTISGNLNQVLKKASPFMTKLVWVTFERYVNQAEFKKEFNFSIYDDIQRLHKQNMVPSFDIYFFSLSFDV